MRCDYESPISPVLVQDVHGEHSYRPVRRGPFPKGRNVKRSVMVLCLVALVGVACGGGESGGDAAGAGHNDADVMFAQQMIVHHEQAIEMAQMAAEQASSAEVKDLAARIEAAQTPEIETMTGWLESWDEPVSAEEDSMAGMDMGGGMSDAQMDELMAASGEEFDMMFLEMMVEHHTGAVEMAEDEIENGEFPAAIELAETIKSAQEKEIQEMEDLLKEMS